MSFVRFIFSPNPGSATYDTPWVIALLAGCTALIVLWFVLRRGWIPLSMNRKTIRSLSSAFLWFGVVGLVLTVCRVEKIQFLAMPFLWVLWALALGAFIVLQARLHRMRHYQVLPRVVAGDPRDKYLPGKRK